jgi:hypothetical protein
MADAGRDHRRAEVDGVRGSRRAAREARWHQFYEPVEGLGAERRCIYCGARAVCEDHVPPMSFLDKAGRQEGLWLYPACLLCNVNLATYPSDCLVLRAEFLLCELRREFIYLAHEVRRQWSLPKVKSAGKNVRFRLDTGRIASACRCAKCAESKTPDPEDRGPRAGEAHIGPLERHGRKIAP